MSDLSLAFRIGKKSTRLVNAAAVKLSEELFNMIDRPDYALVTRVREATESQVKLTLGKAPEDVGVSLVGV